MQIANASGKDGTFYELMKAVDSCRLSYVDYLRPANEADAMKEFLADELLSRPRYDYDEIDIEKLKKKRARIQYLLHEIQVRDDLMDDARWSFIKDLGQSWYQTELILAANDYNQNNGRLEAAKRFERAGDAAFGRMHEDTFWSLMRERIGGIDTRRIRQKDQDIYHEMIDKIGVMGRNHKKRYVPRPELVREFGRQLKALFGGILSHVPEGKNEFTPAEVANVFNEIIKTELNIDFEAVVNKDHLTASVNASKKKIIIPGGRNGNYSRNELEKIIMHELCVHTVRFASARVNGSLPILAQSRSGAYSRLTEEGLAKACEQALDGRYDDLGIVRYLSIGLAQVCKKDFRETFEILWRIEHFASERTKEDCFSIVQRTFRGTGVLPINADLYYYRGYALVWQYIDEHIKDENLMSVLFLSGKNDFLDQKRSTLVRIMREDKLID